MTTTPYAVLLSIAGLLIFAGGVLAFEHGARVGVPAFIAAGVFALLALCEAWVREDA